MWAVVHFENEKSVDAVPSKWLLKQTNECFWPPKNWGTYKIKNSINNSDDPGDDWKVYQVRILGEYDNLNKAKRKATKAMTTSDLSSHSESYVPPNPPRKKTRFLENLQSQSSSSGDESSDSSCNYSHPTLSKNKTKHISPQAQTPVSASTTELSDHNQYSIPSLSTKTTKHIPPVQGKTPLSALTELSCQNQNTPRAENSDTEFQKQVVRQLLVIKNILLQLTENVDMLMKQRTQDTEVTFEEKNHSNEITSMMPIQSLEDLETIETALTNEDIFKSLTKYLARIGGNSAKEMVRRIMYQIFTNAVGMEYSWEGAKKKKIFKKLKLADAILRAVRLNRRTQDCADDEVIAFIKAWLVRAKDRILQKEKSTPNGNVP